MPTLIPSDTGATTITAMDLRRQPGRLLDRVDYRKESFIVERAGEPKAAIVPVGEYRDLQRQRAEAKKRLFKMIDDVREKFKDVEPKEIEREVTKAIKEVRQEAASVQ